MEGNKENKPGYSTREQKRSSKAVQGTETKKTYVKLKSKEIKDNPQSGTSNKKKTTTHKPQIKHVNNPQVGSSSINQNNTGHNNIGSKPNNSEQKIVKRTSIKPKEKPEEKKKKDSNEKENKNKSKEGDEKKNKINESKRIEATSHKLENEKEKEIKFLNEKIKELENKSKEYSKMNDEINKLKQEIKVENKKNNELQLSIKKMEEENKLLKDRLKEESNKKNEIKSDLINNKNNIKSNKIIEGKTNNRNYDIKIRMESLNELLNGWDIKYGGDGMNKYMDMRNKEILLIGILGLKNKGKSYILSKLLKEDEYKKEENDNLYLKYIINKQKNFNYAIIDTPGIGKYLKKNNNKSIKELEKYNVQIDNFLINFILKKSNFILCVVGLLDYNEQKLIGKLKLKDEEYKKEYKQFKKIFIIHNLKELSTKAEVMDYINNILLKSLTFNLIEKEGNLAQNLSNVNCNTKFFIEKNTNQEIEIYHLITAKENTEAGNYYNESVYSFLTEQYNSFHNFNKFDIIKEIKEEIQLISKNILTKPIKSLDDFENIENKIKLKNKFEFYNNSDENVNTDFSYLTLKPKYSYYKINNNSQLLIVIEMPGQIIEQKFICDKKPKNGYYIMTFSGKKILNLPENIDEQKKDEIYFSNIEDGNFHEEIKINIDKFQLKSTKYEKMEEEKGTYKYYFKLIIDNLSSDEENI